MLLNSQQPKTGGHVEDLRAPSLLLGLGNFNRLYFIKTCTCELGNVTLVAGQKVYDPKGNNPCEECICKPDGSLQCHNREDIHKLRLPFLTECLFH